MSPSRSPIRKHFCISFIVWRKKTVLIYRWTSLICLPSVLRLNAAEDRQDLQSSLLTVCLRGDRIFAVAKNKNSRTNSDETKISPLFSYACFLYRNARYVPHLDRISARNSARPLKSHTSYGLHLLKLASAAYQSGDRLCSEYDLKFKDYRNKSGVVYTEISQHLCQVNMHHPLTNLIFCAIIYL